MIYTKILTALSLLSFILIVISVATPGWFVYTMVVPPHFIDIYEDKTFIIDGSSGIWYKKECKSYVDKSHETECTVFSYHRKRGWTTARELSLIGFSVIALEIKTTITVIAISIATILILVYVRDVKRIKLGIIAAVFLFVGGVILAFVTGIFAHANVHYEENLEIEFRIGFPYSLLIAALGFLICFVVVVMLFIVVYMNKTHHHHDIPQSSSLNEPLRGLDENRDPPPAYSEVIGFRDNRVPPPSYSKVATDDQTCNELKTYGMDNDESKAYGKENT